MARKRVQPDARAQIDAWREQGADRLDRVRFHRIDALERRAAGRDGEARRLADARLAQLIQAYAGDLKRAARKNTAAGDARGSAMGGLIDYLAQQTAARDSAFGVGEGVAFPQLAALEDFRAVWSRLRAESQLRQSLRQAPGDAGPLNSGRLVHRSLTLMRELSPGYLQQFLAYVDALTWIEQMSGDGVMELDDALRTGSVAKRGRDKPRKRRE
nr:MULTISPECIES: DUF2894 domain-containing protein [unclassified Lysobacter]